MVRLQSGHPRLSNFLLTPRARVLLPTSILIMPTLNETGVLKLPNKDRASGTARTQNPTRQRKPYVKLSDQELLKQKEKRDEFTARFDAALENAKERIWDIMEDLHAEVPERTAEWWHTYLMQQSKCSKKSKQRAYSTWQAFISLESEKVNSEGGKLLSHSMWVV